MANHICKHLDEKSGRCTLMNISAHASLMDPSTKAPPDTNSDPEAKGRAIKVCGYQIPGWKRGALSCQVPDVEEKQYQIPYFKMYEIAQAATQVINRLSQEPEDRPCGHCTGTGTVTPPQCRIVKSTCPTPTRQGNCPVANKAEGVEDPEAAGPKITARLESLYDKYHDKHMFTPPAELKPDDDEDEEDDDQPRRGRVSTPLQRMRDEGRTP